MPRSITTNASARSINRRLDGLKSSQEKSSSIKKTSGCTSSTTLLDSTITFSPCARIFCSVPAARASSPAGARSQNDRSAPAARNRPESVPLGSYSSLIARTDAPSPAGSQPHAAARVVGAHPVAVLRDLDRRPLAVAQLADQPRHHATSCRCCANARPPPPASALPLQLRQPPLQLRQLAPHLRQPRQVGQLLQVLLAADAPACPTPSRPSARSSTSARRTPTPAPPAIRSAPCRRSPPARRSPRNLPPPRRPKIPSAPPPPRAVPMRQLCPTCTMLSSLVPSPIEVTPSAARSTQEFAPISTKSPISTRPTCGNLCQRSCSIT